ncbi:MAG: tRNA pseudouridine(38-40) synthase TruA [Rickettsiaceae bacterium]|nr:tRNA pseudouridine(38-40) synthase TruA [Rickettsiaceae bacterium]
MRRFKLVIEYDGTGFKGWQKQASSPSIQGAIEAAIYGFSGQSVEVYGSGRTDAGVHALGQVAHFDIDSRVASCQIMGAINFHLKPNKIAIVSCAETSSDFHARFSAINRAYKYKIINRTSPLAIESNRAWLVSRELNLELMQKGASILIGNHDFSSFRASSCGALSPIKTVNSLKIEQIGDIIKIEISAKSFLHHMVRNIVGTLVDLGTGKISYDRLHDILNAKDRSQAGVTAPACGLYFTRVDY